MGKGASLGAEAVLAAAGRAGEISAGVGRVRRAAFSASGYTALRTLPLRKQRVQTRMRFGCPSISARTG